MNTEQQLAYDSVINGESIFLSGAAGTGKTTTLFEIIKWAHTNNKNIGVTATTGSAAFLIRGQTIHSYLSIALATKSPEELASNVIQKFKKTNTKIKLLQILIIDEISLMNNELFDKISEFLCIVRKNPKPFGGLQLVLCGDFYQLAPVEKDYCFMSNTWKKMNIKKIILKKLMRQKDDLEFQGILESLKIGVCTPQIIKRLKQLKETKFEDGITPTCIYGLNVDVDEINNTEYKKLIDNGAEAKTYKNKYSPNTFAKNWFKSCKIPEEVELCIGAQVMLTWNVSVDEGLCNGSRGVIKGFSADGPLVKFLNKEHDVIVKYQTIINDEYDDMSLTFLPLKMAYALTVHRCQGCSIDFCEINLKSWEFGQAYTALSRCRTLKNIRIVSCVKSSYFLASSKVINFYNEI